MFEKPTVLFVKDKVEPAAIAKDSADFKQVLDDFMPLSIDCCDIKQGTLRFVDRSTKYKVDIRMDNLHVLSQNLRNCYDSTALLPASFDASANVYGGKLVERTKKKRAKKR